MSRTGDIIDRIEALVVQIEAGITVSPRYECRIDPADLPTFIIKSTGATRENTSSQEIKTTRDYVLMMLVDANCSDEQSRQEAREATYPYLDSVPLFFSQRRQLENGDNGLGNVISSALFADDGPQLTSWGGDNFSAVIFRLSVTTADWW